MNKNILLSKRQNDPSIVRREYEDPVMAIQNEMNRMFDRFFDDPFGLNPFNENRLSAFMPRVDVSETENEIKVSAELPGMDEKEIEIRLDHENLVISGEKKAENEEKGKNFHRIERSYGSFERVIPLNGEIDPDKVEAVFQKGVLHVTLPKPASAVSKTRKIEIKAK
jgi:HSP20 family protein